MASLNKVILLGNITRDPELKRTPNGVAIARLRLAVNENVRDRQTGQTKEVACYVDVTVWERQAEACGQFLQKGSQIIVDGKLVYEEWKNAQGEARNRLSVRADRVQFINTVRRPDGAPVPGGSTSAPASSPAPGGPAA
ncbi:MAG: single-stranded DNA-binding protein, partial [Kiritimatiellae bacterium]|nr:single-stranded DNA-binding protein [Kiritimatiellia bacterium]